MERTKAEVPRAKPPDESCENLNGAAAEVQPEECVSLERALSAFEHKDYARTAEAAVTLMGLSVGGFFYLHRAPKLTDTDTIVLAAFENKTGDSECRSIYSPLIVPPTDFGNACAGRLG